MALQAGVAPLRPAVHPMQVAMSGGPPGTLMPGDNSLSPEAGNYGRLSDKLKEADLERWMEEEAIAMREEAVQRAEQYVSRHGA